MALDDVPDFLAGLPRWVLWKQEQRNGSATKVPYGADTGERADSTKSADWTPRERVRRMLAMRPGIYAGEGVVLGDLGTGEVLAGIDLDTCLEDGALAEWAKPFLRTLRTYGEVSPSGTGLKLFWRFPTADLSAVWQTLDLADQGGRKVTFGPGKHPPAAEVFVSGRYFTVTGQHWHECPEEVALLGKAAMEALGALLGPRKAVRAGAAAPMDLTAPEPESLAAKLKAALAHRPRMDARYHGSLTGLTDQSGSGYDMSLGAMLKAAGFTYAEMRAVLVDLPHKMSAAAEHAADGDERYFERIWGRTAAETPEQRAANMAREDGPMPRAFESNAHADADPAYGEALLRDAETKAGRGATAPTPEKPTAGPKAPAPYHVGRRSAGLPPIEVSGGQIDLTATLGEEALIASRLPVFRRDKELVRPITQLVPASGGRLTVAAGLDTITLPGLIDLLNQAVEWSGFNKKEKAWKPIDPPGPVAAVILARAGLSRLPSIAGVITTPTLRPDGSVLAEPGYDEATRLYHVHDSALKMPAMPAAPTRTDAERALRKLQDLLHEFPFKGDVDRAVAVSAIVTAVVRGALSVVPMHAFKASAPGSGKSYLVDLVSLIATGRPCPVMAVADQEAETEKRLTGLLLSGFPIISLDNVNGELGGDLLCQAIERPLVRARPLGASAIVEIESRATICATGNALRVKGDMTRRTLVCALDAKTERPELRDFEDDPAALVLADRGEYVAACLTIVRAYLAAGKPNQPPPLASFGEWNAWVRGALLWLGCLDPVASMETAREDDPELSELRELLALWEAAFGKNRGMTARELDEESRRDKHTSMGAVPGELEYPDLRNSLMRVAGEKGHINTRRLGRWFMDKEGRVVGKVKLGRLGTASGGLIRWGVVDAND